MSNYDYPIQLTGFADSVNASGRIGSSAFALVVDLAKVAPVTGLVTDDTVTIGALPENCVVTNVALQIVKPVTLVDGKAIGETKFTVKAGSTTIAAFGDAVSNNGADKSALWAAPATVANGTIGVDDNKETITLVVTSTKDVDSTASAVVGGVVMLTFFVDYNPSSDELVALFQNVDEYVSDGGNTAAEVTIGGGY